MFLNWEERAEATPGRGNNVCGITCNVLEFHECVCFSYISRFPKDTILREYVYSSCRLKGFFFFWN